MFVKNKIREVLKLEMFLIPDFWNNYIDKLEFILEMCD